MKFNEWIKIREMVVQNPNQPAKSGGANSPPEPGEAARKLKTRTTIQKTRAQTVGKNPQAQIAALKSAAQKLATDPNADDESIDNIDDTVKKIQNKAGIKA